MNVRCLAMVHNTTHHCTEADFRYGSKAVFEADSRNVRFALDTRHWLPPIANGSPIFAVSLFRRCPPNRFKIRRVKARLLLGRCCALGTREFLPGSLGTPREPLRNRQKRRSGSATYRARANQNESRAFLGIPRTHAVRLFDETLSPRPHAQSARANAKSEWCSGPTVPAQTVDLALGYSADSAERSCGTEHSVAGEHPTDSDKSTGGPKGMLRAPVLCGDSRGYHRRK